MDLRYTGSNNFVGKPIDGYKREVVILSEAATKALKNVQDELNSANLSIMVYDSYRPQQAVNHFIRWARDLNDTIMKARFYPKVEKRNLFKEGYIASRSGHSRGSTLDITIVDLETCEPLDMGSPYDFFGSDVPFASRDQLANQMPSLKKKFSARYSASVSALVSTLVLEKKRTKAKNRICFFSLRALFFLSQPSFV